jgi:hypothetical protein
MRSASIVNKTINAKKNSIVSGFFQWCQWDFRGVSERGAGRASEWLMPYRSRLDE